MTDFIEYVLRSLEHTEEIEIGIQLWGSTSICNIFTTFNTCLFFLSFLMIGSMLSKTSLSWAGILSVAYKVVFMIVSGKNPSSPKMASTMGSKPFPSMPIWKQESKTLGLLDYGKQNLGKKLNVGFYCTLYLNQVHIKPKSIQGHLHHDLPWKFIWRFKNHISL